MLKVDLEKLTSKSVSSNITRRDISSLRSKSMDMSNQLRESSSYKEDSFGHSLPCPSMVEEDASLDIITIVIKDLPN